MKKNGKRYRALQRKKELKRKTHVLKREIDQEVEDINTSLLSIAQIVPSNPIVHETKELRGEYLARLNSYIRAGKWERRKFEKAELLAYEEIVMALEDIKGVHNIVFYRYFLLLDVIQILGYEIKHGEDDKLEAVKQKILTDFGSDIEGTVIDKIFSAFKDTGRDKYKKIQSLSKNSKLEDESEYIKLMLKNIKFKETKPVGVMVTATMSAGKSTFINALTGKYICLSQNMACTSKIHNIVNKAYEDGYSYEYDYNLEMTAEREELMNDNELNSSDKIVVGTHFAGLLGNERIIISDSPGVNYSENEEHKLITEKLIKERNYHLLIYIMNATQLGTNDEDEHINYVKGIIGRTPVLFVINKIDAFNVDEEDLFAAIERQVSYLKNKGFKNPTVCPVSARAGYLSKRFEEGNLSRSESRELYNFVDKFDKMNLPYYYGKFFKGMKVEDSKKEEIRLQKTCGLAYVEKLIISLTTVGGK